MSSWLHCDVDAAFFLLLLCFLDLAAAVVVASVVPFVAADPFGDALLLGVEELGGLSESRSQCELLLDTPLVDGCSCLMAPRDVASLDPASFFTSILDCIFFTRYDGEKWRQQGQ